MIFSKELEKILDRIDLYAPIPEEEPQSQYYLIKKAIKDLLVLTILDGNYTLTTLYKI